MPLNQNKHLTKILPHGAHRRAHSPARKLFIFTFAAAFTFVALKFPVITDAVSASEFTAGNIISDYAMSNYQSMTLSEIQTFLSEKGNCQDTGIERAAQYPKVHYHVKDKYFVCLVDELFATSGTNYGDLLTDAEKQSAQTAAAARGAIP